MKKFHQKLNNTRLINNMDLNIKTRELNKYKGELKVVGIKTYKMAFSYLKEKMKKETAERDEDKIIQTFIDNYCK